MASPSSGNPNLVWQIPLKLGADVTISTSGRQMQLQAPIDLVTDTLTLDTEGDLVIAGVVSGAGNLIKNNGSALTINSTNTYTGTTISNRGALYISNPAAFGSAVGGTTFTGGFLGFSGSTFVLAEPLLFTGGGILAYGTPTIQSDITLDTTIGIEAFEAQTTITIGGAISGAGGFNKTGPGRVVLNGATKLYAGATMVTEGTLQLDANLASTNPVTVNSGGTLSGNRSTGGTIVVKNGGIVAPGSSPGQITGAGLTMSPGATFAAEIAGPDVNQYDQIALIGGGDLDGATLAVSLSYSPPDGQAFALISKQGAQPLNGAFASLDEGATFQIGGTTFAITYKGGSGNDVILTAGGTPLPTSTATAVPTTTPTATSTPVPTATVALSLCTGDCDDSGIPTVEEIVYGVILLRSQATTQSCARFDTDPDDHVSLGEVLAAVGAALAGCE